MNEEMYKRKYVDTHTELEGVGLLIAGSKSHTIEPGDKNAKDVAKHKKKYEADGFKKRAENLQHMVLDTVDVRSADMLDKKQLPMKDLLKIATGLLPKQVEIKAELHTFSSLWDTVDVTDEVEEIE